jgi:hypothetical protein
MSCLEVARALRLHPGWVEHGRINEAIARDIVERGRLRPRESGHSMAVVLEGVTK